MEAPKVDRLSSLAPELLDYIFELAASTSQLSSATPSKALLPFHERALCQFVRLNCLIQLDRLQQMLDTHAQKALLVRSVSISTTTILELNRGSVAVRRLVARLPNLVEVCLTSEATSLPTVHPSVSQFAQHQFASLAIFRAPGYIVPSSVFQVWSRMPSLREVELADVSHVPGMSFTAVDQVTKLHVTVLCSVRFYRNDPAALLRFFRSAQVVTVDLMRYSVNDTPSVRNFITPTARSLTALGLRDHPSLPRSVDSIGNLSDFSQLQELHLDRHFASGLAKHLRHLTKLTSLSLNLDHVESEFTQLFEGSNRRRHIRDLTIWYGPSYEGPKVNLKSAMKEDWQFYAEDGDGRVLFQHLCNIDEMEGWKILPGTYDVSEEIIVIEEMEQLAREAGVIVTTNLEAIRQAFHRQLIEYLSRSIVEICIDGAGGISDAIRLAETHKMELPEVEIDLGQKVKKEEVEAFKVYMSPIVGGGRECWSYNLRSKK